MKRTLRTGLRSKRALLYAGMVVIIAAAVGFGLDSVFASSGSTAAVTRTATVARGTVQAVETASANVGSATTTSLSFSTSGTLTAVDVAVGDKVTAGEKLATINATQAQQSLATAKTALAAAEQNLTDAQAGGSSSQLEQNKANLSSSQITLQSDEQQLSSDNQALAAAKSQLKTDQTLGCPPATASSSSSAAGGSPAAALRQDRHILVILGLRLRLRLRGFGALGRGRRGLSTQSSATTELASAISTTGATLNGLLNPGGVDTSYYFDYGTSSALGSSTATTDGGAGSSNESVSEASPGCPPARPITTSL